MVTGDLINNCDFFLIFKYTKPFIMKKIISICLILLSVVSLTGYANPVEGPVKKSTKQRVNTYQVRIGFKHLDGSVSTTGYTDSPGFTASNVNTSDEFDCRLNASPAGIFLPYQLPGIIEDLPGGTYEFNAIPGQGNWTGYRNVIVTLSPEMVDADGYVTVYVPIAWQE